VADVPARPQPQVRCDFFALRGVDILLRRSVFLVDVPRVGERIHMWFTEEITVRGTIRDVQWTIPRDGDPTVNVQIELAPADRKRFARRTPLAEPVDPTGSP
jgi:hypothetical protein